MGRQFAIIRTKKLKDKAKVTAAANHNLRYGKFNHNVDLGKTKNNIILLDKIKATSGVDFREKLERRYEGLNVKTRTNNVLAMEFLLTASPNFFDDMSEADVKQWIEAQKEFAKTEFGDNLVLMVAHLDERTPHIHCILATDHTTTKKYKNRYGECEKTTTTLNARRFDRNYLKELQTRFASFNSCYGLSRGVFHSKAKHSTLKDFYRMVNSVSADEKEELAKVLEKLKQLEVELTPSMTSKQIMELVIKNLKLDIYANAKLKKYLEFNLSNIESDLKEQAFKSIEKEIELRRKEEIFHKHRKNLKQVADILKRRYLDGAKPV